MTVDLKLRCSPVLRGLGVDPVGSAVVRTSFLLVDVPLPWPADVADIDELAPVHEAIRDAAAAGARWRVQAVVPDRDGADGGRRRVVAHVLPDGAFDHYRRFSVETSTNELAVTVRALIADPVASGAPETSDVEDLLVCTHGKRDRCCGSSGTSLWTDLVTTGLASGSGRNLARTSHTGGHRFAPTALHLPTGTMWAWLDRHIVGHVLDRDVPFVEVARHYRGSTALATAAEQVVEREILTAVGWEWLSHRRRARVVPIDRSDDVVVEIDHDAPDGTRGRWTAQVREVGRSPVPACGLGLEAATKDAPVLEVVGDGLVRSGRPEG